MKKEKKECKFSTELNKKYKNGDLLANESRNKRNLLIVLNGV